MLCRKCNGPGDLCVRKEYYYCKDCFIINIVHKFRACIGKNKSVFPNEKILICLSGDASSMVLLDLIYNSISLNNYKKLRIIPYFLHVLESEPDKTIIAKSIEEQCRIYNFNVTIVKIDQYCEKIQHLDNNGIINQYLDISKKNGSKIPTSISEDIITKIKQNIFINVAKDLNCRIIFTAETTTLLASRLLSNIAIGRGSQVENDIGFADNRDDTVKILRPMRDITTEEVKIYLETKGLKPAYSSSSMPCASLQSVIKKFVEDLQESSPATISTVCKTADKIGSTNSYANQTKCTVCQSKIECQNLNLTAVDASMFSKKVSLRSSEESSNTENLHHVDNSNNLLFPLIFESLCYCCSRNVSELNPLHRDNAI